MKYLQKGPFTVSVGGGDNYDQTFGKKCFYCKQLIVSEDAYEWGSGAHKACMLKYERDTEPEPEPAPTSDGQK